MSIFAQGLDRRQSARHQPFMASATLSISEAEQLVRAGAAALQAGRASEAKQSLERVAASGRANLQVWLLLAYACRQAGDSAGAEQAADEVLAVDHRNLRALLVKGDARLAGDDPRTAGSFYSTALKLAAQMGELPSDLTAELERAKATFTGLTGDFRVALERRLAVEGFDGQQASARFRESIAILLEEKQVYLQQPSAYYFPGLPQLQYYEREAFSWVPALEAAAGDMRAELEALRAAEAPFKPYIESRKDRPTYDFHGLLDNPDWSTLYLWENGGPVAEHVARCPRTFAAVQQAPLCHITSRAPSILFSLLKAGARIAPHNGMINTRLICHLPLIVPEGCGFRVGNEVRQWEVGKLLIFDDTIEHEAWNESQEDRVILIFDVWRPELSLEEQRAVTTIFEVLDA